MSKPLIFVDVDGVLLDYMQGLLRFINSPIKTHEVKEYDLVKAGVFSNMQEMMRLMDEYHNSMEFAFMPELKFADVVRALVGVGELHILSSVAGENVRAFRTEILKRRFGYSTFDSFAYTEHSECKVEHIQMYLHSRFAENRQNQRRFPDLCFETFWPKFVVLIEDKPSTLEIAAQSTNITPLGIKQPYNHGKVSSDIPMYNNMAHVVDHIKGMLV